MYDATYLTLAVRHDTTLVTADDRLADRIAGHASLARHVRRLQEPIE
jgi:predicted nucleic acid-binding protein